MRAPLWLAVVLLLVPPALAQEGESPVEIVDVVLPERTAAGHAFPVEVTLRNLGSEPVEAALFGALYPDPPEARASCGAVREFGGEGATTNLAVVTLTLAPGETRVYPGPRDEAWLHRYLPDDAPETPSLRRFCVQAIEPEEQGRLLDLAPLALDVRARNVAPDASFSHEPGAPVAAQPVTFRASASDAEGDPLTYAWDFGHRNASGQGAARGPEVAHAFWPAGAYTVTLTVSDGFDARQVVRTLQVAPEPPEGVDTQPERAQDEGASPLPLPPWVSLAAVGLALAVRRRAR